MLNDFFTKFVFGIALVACLSVIFVAPLIRDSRIEALEQTLITTQLQLEEADKAAQKAKEEKKKVEEEYVEKTKQLKLAIEAHGLCTIDLPDDVLRLLEEGSTSRAFDVPASSNAPR